MPVEVISRNGSNSWLINTEEYKLWLWFPYRQEQYTYSTTITTHKEEEVEEMYEKMSRAVDQNRLDWEIEINRNFLKIFPNKI